MTDTINFSFEWDPGAFTVVSENGLTDVVTQVRFTLVATDTSVTPNRVVRHKGLIQLDPPTPQNFVACSSLTADQVSAWVKVKLGDYQLQQLQTQLTNQLVSLANPPVQKTPPWIPTPAPQTPPPQPTPAPVASTTPAPSTTTAPASS